MSPYIYLLLTIMVDGFPAYIAVRVDQNNLPTDAVLYWKETENNKALFDLVGDHYHDEEKVIGVREIHSIVVL